MEPSLVVVGTSLGGFAALKILLAGLPPRFSFPVLIVQHRGKWGGEKMAELLALESTLPVSEPEDKEPLVTGRVYLAPADYHLLVEKGWLALSTEGPVSHARPSVDVLFESAADAYGRGVVGVVLTGLNQDGASGCARIKRRGGVVLVQDPKTAESDQMPSAAIAAAPVDRISSLNELSAFLGELCRSRREGE
jgi:two-component system, chemotaxis family, protein-glutamate methylesterase/glutaminase